MLLLQRWAEALEGFGVQVYPLRDAALGGVGSGAASLGADKARGEADGYSGLDLFRADAAAAKVGDVDTVAAPGWGYRFGDFCGAVRC